MSRPLPPPSLRSALFGALAGLMACGSETTNPPTGDLDLEVESAPRTETAEDIR